MIIGRKWYRIQHYLGDRQLTESWAVEDDETSMLWLAEYKRSTLEHFHPEVRVEITHFTEGATEVFRPLDPAPLEEVVG